jgi:hypothetical protein
MQVIGISVVLNEAPLVEAFVRHHAGLLDHHIILDDGSTDDTIGILQRLRMEGLPISVYQATSVIYAQGLHMTGLYKLALQAGADWVVCLDCDELLDTRKLPGTLQDWLAALPQDTALLQLPLVDYVAPSAATDGFTNVFERLVRRVRETAAAKVLARRLAPDRVVIGAGSHGVAIDGRMDFGAMQDRVVLGHYPERSPLQFALKSAIWRLKVVAHGGSALQAGLAWHSADMLAMMKRAPRAALAAAARRAQERSELVDDPGLYRGGALQYTAPPDDDARLVALLLTYAERLATSHGDLLARNPDLLTAVLQSGVMARRLL